MHGRHQFHQVSAVAVGRLLNVGGNSETMFSQTVPGWLATMAKRFAPELGALAGVVMTASYLLQSAPMRGMRADAITVPLLLTSSRVSGPAKSDAAFAYNDARYRVEGRTGIPQKPSFATPTR